MAAASAAIVVGRHQQAGFAVGDDLRNAARARRGHRAAARHRLENRRAEPLSDRAHRKHVERLHQPERVAAKAGEQDVPLEAEVFDLLLERRP
jgi:hypothetical protein